jgi:ABC-2 type transport system ATP-binding protein
MIRCQGLSHRFGSTLVLRELTFEVGRGAVCALLGPNGAGKSTTLGLLTGLLRAPAGCAFVGGMDVSRGGMDLRRRLGVVPEDLGLFEDLTLEEHLLLVGPLYGLSRPVTEARCEDLLLNLALESGRYTLARNASYGMRKKLALAMALLHDPEVLFLDEPFEGLDPVTADLLQGWFRLLSQRGVTVCFTSHLLPRVEAVATQVLMLKDGRIVWEGDPARLGGGLAALYFDRVEAPREAGCPWLGSSRS